MFICIYQPIYTFCLVGALRSLCAATVILRRCRRPYCAAMATSRLCRRLTALLRGTRGDPTALSQDGVPTVFVLSMFKVRAVSRRSLEMPQRSLRLDGAQVSNCQKRTSLIDTANLKHCRTPPLFTAYLWHNTASTLSSCQP